MNDLALISDSYTRLSTEELLQLAGAPDTIRPEAIPILQKELISRHRQEEALALSDYLVNGRPRSLKHLTNAELRKMIDERLDAGEPLESIQLDLRDNGINIFDIIQHESKAEQKTMDYLVELKEQGLDEHEINAKMQAAFSMGEEQSEVLKARLKRKARQNLVIGYSLIAITGVIIFISLTVGGRVYIGSVLLLAIGIWRVAEGRKQQGA